MRSPWIRLAAGVPIVAAVFVVQALAWKQLHVPIGLIPAAAIASLIAAAGGWAAFVLIARWLEHRPPTELRGPGAARELGAGIALGAGLFGATIGVLALAGVYTAVPTGRAELLLVPLFVAIGSGVIEEVLFRGMLFRLVEEALGTWIALAVSSAFFGFGHLMNPGATLQGVVAIVFEAGVLLGAAYLLTRRLWLAIGLHGAWNFTQSGIFGVPTSGVPMQGLLRGRLDGPIWLSGGEFGAEASVVALVVCGGAGLWLLRKAWRAGRFVPPPWRRAPGSPGAPETLRARSPASADPAAAPSGP